MDPDCVCYLPLSGSSCQLELCGRGAGPACWLSAPGWAQGAAGGAGTFSFHQARLDLCRTPGFVPVLVWAPPLVGAAPEWERPHHPNPVGPREIKVPRYSLHVARVTALWCLS